MTSQNKSKAKKKLSADEFDTLADSGQTLGGHVDWSKAVKIINVSLPVWMIKGLDSEANRINIDRQAVIKTWLAEKLDLKAGEKKTSAV